MDEFDAKAFPYPIVTVDTGSALAERARLAQDGVAVILGDDERAARVAADIEMRERSPEDIIAAAAGLRFPEDWVRELARQHERARALIQSLPQPQPGSRSMAGLSLNLVVEKDGIRDATPDEIAEMEARAEEGPRIGEWPDAPEEMEFSAAVRYPGVAPNLHIAMLPSHDATEAPAFLNFGGWNACPAPEYHIAALRLWRDSFGASVVTCGSDLLELCVGQRPASRDAAMTLAREQYDYCNDLIEQGFGDFARLAASLTVSDWWSFWWD